MNPTSIKNFASLVLLAQELKAIPFDQNPEYGRGQIELIMYFCGISTEYEENYHLTQTLITSDLQEIQSMVAPEIAEYLSEQYKEKVPSLTEAEMNLLVAMHPAVPMDANGVTLFEKLGIVPPAN